MNKATIGIIGASSPLGRRLIHACEQQQRSYIAFSRQPDQHDIFLRPLHDIALHGRHIEHWICVAPTWTFASWCKRLEAAPVKRCIFLSSTSASSKEHSSDASERLLSQRLVQGEHDIEAWCTAKGVTWSIFRTTLIYGHGDRNVDVIRRVIRKTGFFPFLGAARGLRQPLHVDDLANLCIAAVDSDQPFNRTAIVTGGECLQYRDMVVRIFLAIGRKPRTLTIPSWLAMPAVHLLRILPRFRHLNRAMLDRMNTDLAFECDQCVALLGVNPRRFTPTNGTDGVQAQPEPTQIPPSSAD